MRTSLHYIRFVMAALLIAASPAWAADAPAKKNVPTKAPEKAAAPAKATTAAPKAAASKPAATKAEVKPTQAADPAKAPAKPVAPAQAEIPNSTTTPLNRDGARHQLINSRAKENAGNVDLLFIGDSITAGWEKNGAEVWEKFYGNRKAMNAGIGGDRTQHILWRLENGNIDGISPKLVVLMIGTNNSGSNTSQEIADGVKAIVAKLRSSLPQTKVLLLAIFPRGADKSDERRLVNEGANAEIAKLADGHMVHFLDIGSEFLEDDGTLSKEIMPDLLHLSPAGYTIWAESIEDKVAELLGESSAVYPATGGVRRSPGLFRRFRLRR